MALRPDLTAGQRPDRLDLAILGPASKWAILPTTGLGKPTVPQYLRVPRALGTVRAERRGAYVMCRAASCRQHAATGGARAFSRPPGALVSAAHLYVSGSCAYVSASCAACAELDRSLLGEG